MKKISGYLLSMMLVLISLILIDAVIVFFICVQKENEYLNTFHIEKVSDQIINIDGDFQVEQSVYELLDKTASFAMIIDDSGK